MFGESEKSNLRPFQREASRKAKTCQQDQLNTIRKEVRFGTFKAWFSCCNFSIISESTNFIREICCLIEASFK